MGLHGGFTSWILPIPNIQSSSVDRSKIRVGVVRKIFAGELPDQMSRFGSKCFASMQLHRVVIKSQNHNCKTFRFIGRASELRGLGCKIYELLFLPNEMNSRALPTSWQ